MAILFNQNEEDENQNQQQVTNPGLNTSTQSSQPTQPASATPSPGAGTSSGRFSNLTNYLKANQGFNQQGGGLAGKVAGNINTQGDKITQNVASAVQNFNQKSGDQVSQVQQGANLASQAVQDPTAFVQNQDNVAKVTQARDAQYTGPKSLMDLEGKDNQAALQNQAKNLQTTTQQGQTEAGRYNLLRTMFNKPTYSSGQQNLDNLLIQGNKDQLKQIAATRKTSGAVNQALQQNAAAAQAQGQQAIQQVDAARNQVRDQLTGALTSADSALETARGDAETARQIEVDRVKEQIKQGEVERSLLSKLGLNEGQDLYGLDLSQYVNPNKIAATKETVGSADDYARIQALGQLAGSGLSPEIAKLIDTYKGAQAGKFASEAQYNINQDQVQQALRDRKADYDRQTTEAQDIENLARRNLQSNVVGGRDLSQYGANLDEMYANLFNPESQINTGGVDDWVRDDVRGAYEAQQRAIFDAQNRFSNLKNFLGKKLSVKG